MIEYREPATLRIALAQLAVNVGAFGVNADAVVHAMRRAEAAGADLLVTPEMHLSGYPAEDLLAQPGFLTASAEAIRDLAWQAGQTVTLLGAPLRLSDFPELPPQGADGSPLDAQRRTVSNAAVVLHDGEVRGVAVKRRLPTYSVFDDARHFAPGSERTVMLRLRGVAVAVLICEDMWDPAVADQAAADGARVIVALNASPFYVGKPAMRERLVTETALRTGTTVVYVNSVGSQDEVVFDGGSLAVGPDGDLLVRASAFSPQTLIVDVPVGRSRSRSTRAVWSVDGVGRDRPELPELLKAPLLTDTEQVYSAAVLGLRDYFTKTGFTKAVLGLSGGIDSALVAVIARDALGAENVWGVALPGPFSSEHSVTDAAELATNLGISFDVVDIGAGYDERLSALGPLVSPQAGRPAAGAGVARENLQARLRAVTLMALANTHNMLLLTTGNKSETAVGFMTIGGDALGTAPNPVGDCWKTAVTYADGVTMPGVYDLARWRNARAVELGEIAPIPLNTLTKVPSAELAPDQVDSDSLPPYEILDPLLAAFLEEHASPEELVEQVVAAGLEVEEATAVVSRVLRLIEVSEWKRRQGVPRIKLTRLAFGRDRRMPIANAWRCQPAPPQDGG